MRCARCGNENPAENRFCGMCGATLLQAPTAGTVAAVQGTTTTSATPTPATTAPVRPQTPDPHRAANPVSENAPVISGPSFLGLNDPAPRKRGSLSIDPSAAPSSHSLDYLLDDEGEPKSGGGGKIILILVALALAVGFGYLRWKNQGFAWLNSGPSKPSAAAQNSAPTDSSSAAAPAKGTSAAPAPGQPATGPLSQPATDSGSPGGVAAPSAAPAPAAATPTTAGPAASTPATTPATAGGANPAASVTPPNSVPAAADASPGGGSAPPTQSPANSAATTAPPAGNSTTAANPPPASEPSPAAVPKPPATIKPLKPVDPVSEAQKYIYGRGVRQDCERGLRILKPAAEQANPKAMIEMGALYSAGLCTPHDLPTAYRWFALALRKDPANQSVQTDLEKLWGEMTQPERQLAIRLSQ